MVLKEYQIVISFAFTHKFTKEECDNGEPLSHEFCKSKVVEMLNRKDYSYEEQEL